jgi:hypothetical protein
VYTLLQCVYIVTVCIHCYSVYTFKLHFTCCVVFLNFKSDTADDLSLVCCAAGTRKELLSLL